MTLVALSAIAFAATNVRSPESIARNDLGLEATPEQVEAWVEERGLDAPLVTRYVTWAGATARGDFGQSILTDLPVASQVVPRLVNTLILAALALAISFPLSLAVGARLARRTGSKEDAYAVVGTTVLHALPEFVIGVAMIMIFAVSLGLLPATSTALIFGSRTEHLNAFILPALTLAISLIPNFVRMSRVSVREVMRTPYVRAATLRGLRPSRVLWAHTMPNAAAPVIGYLSLSFIHLISSTIIVENVFAFPGLGQALVNGINAGDTPTILVVTMLMGLMFVGFQIICDVCVIYLNPRLRTSI